MTETSKTVRSLGLGKSMLATFPPSSSAISVRFDYCGVLMLLLLLFRGVVKE